MNKQWMSIVFLSVMAVVLAALNFAAQQPAWASTTVRDRDYQLVTTRIQAGGEALYVYDIRSGNVVVYTFDPARRTLVPRATLPVAAAFRR
jgi:hypothetical protein